MTRHNDCADDPVTNLAIQAGHHNNRSIIPGESVCIDADQFIPGPFAGGIWQYAWRFVAVPDGSRAELANRNLVRARFTPDVPGRYLVQLDATTVDGVLRYITRVCVSEDRRGPVAVAAAEVSRAVAGSPVQLDGSASINPVAGPLAYRWKVDRAPAGSRAALVQAASPKAVLKPDRSGRYALSLHVRNADSFESVDRLTLEVATAEERLVTADRPITDTATAEASRTARNAVARSEHSSGAAEFNALKTFALSGGASPSRIRRRPSALKGLRKALSRFPSNGLPATDPASSF